MAPAETAAGVAEGNIEVTVKELIEKLEMVEDKDSEIAISAEHASYGSIKEVDVFKAPNSNGPGFVALIAEY